MNDKARAKSPLKNGGHLRCLSFSDAFSVFFRFRFVYFSQLIITRKILIRFSEWHMCHFFASVTILTPPFSAILWPHGRWPKLKLCSTSTPAAWTKEKGKQPFAPYSGFNPGTWVLPTRTSARQRYHPCKMLEAKLK